METTIGDYDADSRTVPVTFSMNGVTHERTVNACHDDAGKYDPEATIDRVEEVARGVARKIELGAITNPPPAPIEE